MSSPDHHRIHVFCSGPIPLTLHQIEALAIIAGMVTLFISDRLRYGVTP
jgi:hypothetical protein